MFFSFPTARLKEAWGWSCWEAFLKKKGKEKGRHNGVEEEDAIKKKKGNNPMKMHPLNKTKSANTNM